MYTSAASIIAVITIIAAHILLVGMISPKIVLIGKNKTRKNVIKVYGLAILFGLLSIVVLGLLSKPDIKVSSDIDISKIKNNGNVATTKKGNIDYIDEINDKTLGWFAEQDKDDRNESITPMLMDFYGIDNTHKKDYINCIGEFAKTKSQSLNIVEVFGWCVKEMENNNERFLSMFNELDEPDRSSAASAVCKQAIKDMLISPSTADFPFLPDATFRGRKSKYTIKTHVDSQNAYGALIRSKWHCEVQYSGSGNDYDISSWTVSELEQQM